MHPVLMPVAAADGRETLSHRIVIAPTPYVVETLTRAANFKKYDARTNGDVSCNCPRVIAEGLAARGEWPDLRVLVRVINAPTLRSDGSLLDRPGYDAASGLLYEPGSLHLPPIPSRPTRDAALTALGVLKNLLVTFPFISGEARGADLSVALVALLTVIVRPTLATSPLIAISAPVPGSGKTTLVDMIATVGTGRPAPAISQGASEEETEKRFGAAQLAGDGIISIDNCDRPLTGAALCQATTQRSMKVRVLGQSLNVEVPCNAVIFATGNNLVIGGDLTRRVLLCSLDPQCERPELRVFDADPLAVVTERRGEFVAAALTVLRAHRLSGWRSELPPLGSFVEWSRIVRDPLLWLGEVDPCETMETVRAHDPQQSRLKAVLDGWEQAIGEVRVPLSAVIANAAVRLPSVGGGDVLKWPAFHEALMAVARGKDGVNPGRLGIWCGTMAGRIAGGRRLVRAGDRGNAALWQLETVDA